MVILALYLHKNFYDAEGLRNRIEENGKATDFVYSGDMLYSEKDESGATERHYILGNEYLGHETVRKESSDANACQKQAYSYITDEHGSLRYILNADRQTETYQEYSAFGEMITSEGGFSRLGYNSQMEDELTRLTYLRARYYNPETGRFTQEDVIYDDGFNLYTYCSSNPVIYCDPSGFVQSDKTSCIIKSGDGNDSLWTPVTKENGLWSKGKLKKHYEKHGITEFGAKSSKEYSNMAYEFGTRQSNSIIQAINGAYVYRYEPSTGIIFVGTKGGKIKSFYKWDGRENDAVIATLKGLDKL
ncbi:MAG: RHS repeat-associated core domain-containing protein [Lachnospiraceae bacterium]|nr:RHS repeat-associated core domain-containing protein [Lachnospiraceae bacterium]